MIKVSVLYPNLEGLVFDKEYYLNKHVPLVSKLLGEALKNVQVDFGLTGGSHEESAIYVVMTHLTFDSIESFEKIFPIHAEELLSDIPRFTNSRPQLQISEVTI